MAQLSPTARPLLGQFKRCALANGSAAVSGVALVCCRWMCFVCFSSRLASCEAGAVTFLPSWDRRAVGGQWGVGRRVVDDSGAVIVRRSGRGAGSERGGSARAPPTRGARHVVGGRVHAAVLRDVYHHIPAHACRSWPRRVCAPQRREAGPCTCMYPVQVLALSTNGP